MNRLRAFILISLEKLVTRLRLLIGIAGIVIILAFLSIDTSKAFNLIFDPALLSRVVMAKYWHVSDYQPPSSFHNSKVTETEEEEDFNQHFKKSKSFNAKMNLYTTYRRFHNFLIKWVSSSKEKHNIIHGYNTFIFEELKRRSFSPRIHIASTMCSPPAPPKSCVKSELSSESSSDYCVLEPYRQCVHTETVFVKISSFAGTGTQSIVVVCNAELYNFDLKTSSFVENLLQISGCIELASYFLEKSRPSKSIFFLFNDKMSPFGGGVRAFVNMYQKMDTVMTEREGFLLFGLVFEFDSRWVSLHSQAVGNILFDADATNGNIANRELIFLPMQLYELFEFQFFTRQFWDSIVKRFFDIGASKAHSPFSDYGINAITLVFSRSQTWVFDNPTGLRSVLNVFTIIAGLEELLTRAVMRLDGFMEHGSSFFFLCDLRFNVPAVGYCPFAGTLAGFVLALVVLSLRSKDPRTLFLGFFVFSIILSASFAVSILTNNLTINQWIFNMTGFSFWPVCSTWTPKSIPLFLRKEQIELELLVIFHTIAAVICICLGKFLERISKNGALIQNSCINRGSASILHIFTVAKFFHRVHKEKEFKEIKSTENPPEVLPYPPSAPPLWACIRITTRLVFGIFFISCMVYNGPLIIISGIVVFPILLFIRPCRMFSVSFFPSFLIVYSVLFVTLISVLGIFTTDVNQLYSEIHQEREFLGLPEKFESSFTVSRLHGNPFHWWRQKESQQLSPTQRTIRDILGTIMPYFYCYDDDSCWNPLDTFINYVSSRPRIGGPYEQHFYKTRLVTTKLLDEDEEKDVFDYNAREDFFRTLPSYLKSTFQGLSENSIFNFCNRLLFSSGQKYYRLVKNHLNDWTRRILLIMYIARRNYYCIGATLYFWLLYGVPLIIQVVLLVSFLLPHSNKLQL